MAFVKKISIDDFAKHIKKHTVDELKKTVIKAVYSGVLRSQERLNKETPVDTGHLLASWRIEKHPTGPEPSVIIGNEAKYAGVVLEHGAKPFDPPIKPLLEWVARKFKKPKDSAFVHRVAWAIKYKIKNKGIPARKIFSKAIDNYILPNVKRELQKAK